MRVQRRADRGQEQASIAGRCQDRPVERRGTIGGPRRGDVAGRLPERADTEEVADWRIVRSEQGEQNDR